MLEVWGMPGEQGLLHGEVSPDDAQPGTGFPSASFASCYSCSSVLISNKAGSSFAPHSKQRGQSVLSERALIYPVHLLRWGMISVCPCKGIGVIDVSAMRAVLLSVCCRVVSGPVPRFASTQHRLWWHWGAGQPVLPV